MASSTRETILKQWSLESRNYVVTGGSDGIGLATVRGLLAHGASAVVFCSRRPRPDLVASLREEYCRNNDNNENTTSITIEHVVCDVSVPEGRNTLVERTKQILLQQQAGGDTTIQLHGLVNNVGTNIRKPLLEQSEEEYHAMAKTNIDSAYFLCKMFSPLLAADGSTVVNVSSAAGVQSSGTGAAYGLTKAALNQFTKILACEWASRNIRVNAITPWMTMTPMLEDAVKKNPAQLDRVKEWTPLSRLATPEEIAAPIVFLCLPASSYITGQVLGVDGGLTAQGFRGPTCA